MQTCAFTVPAIVRPFVLSVLLSARFALFRFIALCRKDRGQIIHFYGQMNQVLVLFDQACAVRYQIGVLKCVR